MAEKIRSDDELGEAMRAGDLTAFRHIFTTYYPSLCSLAFSIVKRRDLAEDVCSRMFEELWRKREVLQITTSLKGYLFSAVRNRSINLLHSEMAHSTSYVDLQTAERELTENRTAKDDLCDSELEAGVRGLMDRMPEQRRTAFVLSRFENLRYREIAVIMGLSERTVQNHIILAVKDLEEYRPRLREYLR